MPPSTSTSTLNRDEVAISVSNVSKAYRIWRDPSARLKAPIAEAWQKLRAKSGELLAKASGQSAPSSKLTAPSSSPYYKDFYALKDVSFEVKKGEAVGIIGRNGSGKSTLLQMIAGTLTPTSGSIKVNGRVAALLELGSGFNPQFTGRENVFMNAAILGLASKETEQLFNEIEQFADIGDFINQPVKTYSSGMLMRLAFAVQAMVKPDILIIDEALSVGDFFFTQKCFALIRKLKENGTTLLFVSHDMASVRDICPRAFLLKEGSVQIDAETTKTINHYFTNSTEIHEDKKETINSGSRQNIECVLTTTKKPASKLDLDEKVARIITTKAEGPLGDNLTSIKMGEEITFTVNFEAAVSANYRICIAIKNRQNLIVTSNSCLTTGLDAKYLSAGESAIFQLKLKAMFEAGPYSYKAFLAKDNFEANRNETIDETDWLMPFTITWDYQNAKAPFLGMFGPPVSAMYK